jgi:hypothetical protein
MKKTIVVLFLIFLLSSLSDAQIYKGFGVKLGTSMANQVQSPFGLRVKNKFGFTCGLFKEFRLIEKLNVVAGINYAQKGTLEEFENTNEYGYYIGTDYIHRNINFATIELIAKYDGNTSNYYPYILAGLRMDIFISSKNTLNGNEINYSSYYYSINNNKTFGGVIGLGFDYKPSKLFALFIEGLYNPDFTNLGEKTDPYGFTFYTKGNSFDIRTGIKF